MTANHGLLFDPATTEKPRCPHCGAAARNACGHDADIHDGLKEPLSRRPQGCVASAQLGPDEELPF